MAKQIKLLAAGLGSRWGVYADYIARHPEDIKVVGLADADPKRLEAAAHSFGVPETACYTDALDLFGAGIEADGAIICTMDALHYPHSIAAMQAGYHLMLEKPAALTEEQCRAIRDTAQRLGRHVVVCHVLRYTPFYQKIKDIIDSGVIGEVCTVQAMERVEYWHMAHAYVRGNWRRADTSCPMILAKSCHDTDILLWLCGKKCKAVSSFGSLKHFRPENQPEGAADRCLECKYVDTCPYSAKHQYIDRVAGGYTGWPVDVVKKNPTVQSITDVLKTSPYGKCVYRCDNDVVDHQILNMWLEDDVAVSFVMSSFNSKSGRTIKVLGTLGDIEADMGKNEIECTVFGKSHEVIDVSKLGLDLGGHGGGDDRLFADFVALLRGEPVNSKSLTSIERSMESHFVSLAAERSRVAGGQVINMSEY